MVILEEGNMKIIKYSLLTLLGCLLISSFSHDSDGNEVWGFYGHKLINRTAVFTLPIDLIPLYKSNLDFVVDHSVDPDKRRHASPLEAVRHYIDIDQWGDHPYEEVPRMFTDALLKYGQLDLINAEGDTVKSWSQEEQYPDIIKDSLRGQLRHEIQIRTFELLEEKYINLPTNWVSKDSNLTLYYSEGFSEFGILPYHLSLYQNRLTKAFKNNDWPLVLRLSTEMGHYISDGHVPLHTTLNYNGQLTGQDGIHAFWESRIPELFAEAEYDLFTGRAKYIEDTDAFFWDIILSSNLLVDDVLSKELQLREEFKKDKQYCFDERNNNTVRVECEQYAKAYAESLDGMVESQMRKAIAAVGSAWFTAWVDADRPLIPALDSLIFGSQEIIKVDTSLMIKK